MSRASGSSSGEKHKQKKLDVNLIIECIQLIIECIQLIVVICAVATLYFSLYPQRKPHNTNLLEMANAGDYSSQIKLADFSYETGDFSEAVYWYKMAAINDMNNGEGVIGLNNLAYLYSHGYGLAEEALTEKDRLQIALSLLDKAVDTDRYNLDEDMLTVAMNKYILLITFGENMFDNYDAELDSVYSFLRKQKSFGELVIVPERRIVSQEIISSFHPLHTGWADDNTRIVFSGSQTVRNEDGYFGTQYLYVQTVYEEGTEKLPELKYITP